MMVLLPPMKEEDRQRIMHNILTGPGWFGVSWQWPIVRYAETMKRS